MFKFKINNVIQLTVLGNFQVIDKIDSQTDKLFMAIFVHFSEVKFFENTGVDLVLTAIVGRRVSM